MHDVGIRVGRLHGSTTLPFSITLDGRLMFGESVVESPYYGRPQPAKVHRLDQKQRSSPVSTECNATLFEFAPVEGRQAVAAFDGGAITSDAGALLLGETDRAIRLTARFATCFTDARLPELVEHLISTMVLQRVVGIAL